MRKGFTLIELLAVIVILAIIALIAVPIVVNIINDSKKESLQRSIDLYIDHVQKAVAKYQMTHPDFNPSTCEIKEKGNLDCNGIEIQVEMKGQVPESGTIIFQNNKLLYENLLLEEAYYHMDIDGKKEKSKEKKNKEPEQITISETKDYKGYYADVDGDGEVDGVIYADLAYASRNNAKWGPGSEGQYVNNGTYSYTAQTNLKKYTISENKYSGNFGDNEIISLKKGSSGNKRFYVMALDDFVTTTYTTFYWYRNASGRMSTWETDTSTSFGKGYANTGKMIEVWNKNGAGDGSYSGATQDNRDILKYIQSEYAKGWYIPSKEEWAAFADYFKITSDYDTGSYVKNSGNYYIKYELSKFYGSSSQYSISEGWGITFYGGCIDHGSVNTQGHARLGFTF